MLNSNTSGYKTLFLLLQCLLKMYHPVHVDFTSISSMFLSHYASRCTICSAILTAFVWTPSKSSASFSHRELQYLTSGFTTAEVSTLPNSAKNTHQHSLLQGPMAEFPAFSELTSYVGGTLITVWRNWESCEIFFSLCFVSSHCRYTQIHLQGGCKLGKLRKATTELRFKTFWASLQIVDEFQCWWKIWITLQ